MVPVGTAHIVGEKRQGRRRPPKPAGGFVCDFHRDENAACGAILNWPEGMKAKPRGRQEPWRLCCVCPERRTKSYGAVSLAIFTAIRRAQRTRVGGSSNLITSLLWAKRGFRDVGHISRPATS